MASEYERWCVEPSLFDDHLSALCAAGYDFLTVSGLIDALDRGALPERPLVVTFDDGRADFVDNAVPVLERYGVPSTMYVVAGAVGGTSSWLGIPGESNQPMMTWTELDSIAAAGHEVGAHSLTHRQLDVLPIADATIEIRDSRIELEDGLGRPIRSFAYPHGYHSDAVVAATRAAGYESAGAVNDRWSWVGESRYALSRLIVEGASSAEELIGRLAEPPSTPQRRSRVLQTSWRCVRWVRHRQPAGMAR